MEESEKKMKSAGVRGSAALGMIGKAAAGAAAGGILAFGLAVGKSVSLAADFEQQMSRLSASLLKNGARPAAKDMDALKKSAMAAGAATKFSALDAAKAQTELATGGLKVAQILKGGLSGALALAASGEIDLADAAKYTAKTLGQFQLDGSQATHVADALSQAAIDTSFNVSDLALGLAQGGGAAKSMGLSFDQAVVGLEALSKQTNSGSDAGTSLKTALIQLNAPTKKAAEAAKAAGLSFKDQHGNMKSLIDISAMLRAKTADMTATQRSQLFTTLAGTDGFRTLIGLYQEGPTKLTAYADALKVQGTAAKVAAEKQDNLRGKIENLKGSLETAAISLGEGLLPGLTDGAEKATDAINEMAASGDLERLGNQLGDITEQFVDLGPTIVASMGPMGDAMKGMVTGLKVGFLALLQFTDPMLTALTGIADAFNLVSGAVGGPKINTAGISKARDEVRSLRDTIIRDLAGKEVKVPVRAEVGQAAAALRAIGNVKLRDKVVKILGSNDSAQSKIDQIRRLGIPDKIAKILTAGVPRTLAEIAAVRNALSAVGNKTVSLTVNKSIRELVSRSNPSSMGKTPPKRAMGRGSMGAERALVGEGTGPELVVDEYGRMQWVTSPTIMDLGAGDYVIPSDPQYSGRALGLMFSMLGVPGYAKGRKPKALPIPAAIQFGAVPEDELMGRRDDAREAYQKRKDRVHDLDVDIRAQRKRVGDTPIGKGKDKGRARSAAQRKLEDLQRDRHRYSDGGQGLASLTDMRKQWQDLQRQAGVLHKVNLEIDRLNTLQETERTRMATFAKKGDPKGWGAAKNARGGILGILRAKYAAALRLAKPGSNFAAELAGKLAGVEGDIADIGAEAFELAESPFTGGMSKAEQDTLAGLQAAQSLASLTADLGDDQAAAVATAGFLGNILQAVIADPSRGGAAAIRDVADQVKQARDNVASFAGGGASGNENADVAAQLAQRDEQLRVSRRDEQIASRALGVFQGFNGSGLTQNIYTLHPGDPATLRAVGDAAAGGFNLQPFVSSPRQTTGL